MEIKHFSVHYYHSLPAKAVISLDIAPFQPYKIKLRSADGTIFVCFLPPNMTTLIQSMDHMRTLELIE
ncbi:hypothetical protein PR048_013585 [Dryococelus australis]|uniref:Uncharacterized protein n=1 Tax=Dryococelus australis TaxID=614101 RepID=A0ABQ9HSL0_9NEOP|nr:hypothetical protein PR048_013585 [Dryococelus australis]